MICRMKVISPPFSKLICCVRVNLHTSGFFTNIYCRMYDYQMHSMCLDPQAHNVKYRLFAGFFLKNRGHVPLLGLAWILQCK